MLEVLDDLLNSMLPFISHLRNFNARILQLLLKSLMNTKHDGNIDFLYVPLSAVYLEDSFIKSGVFSVTELVRVSRSKYMP